MNAGSIVKHSAVLFVARTANPAASVILGLYVARVLGVEIFGQYSFILSCCFVISVVFSLGLGTVIGREIVQDPARTGAYCINASLIGLGAGVPAVLVTLVLARWFSLAPEGLRTIEVMSISVLPSILIRTWEAMLVSLRRNQAILAIEALEGAAKLAAGLAALSTGHGLVWLMAVFLITRMASAVLYLRAVRPYVPPHQSGLDLAVLKSMLTLLPTFAGLYVLSALFSKIDVLMLAGLRDFNAVGIYSAAYKLLDISFMLPTCVVAVLFPLLCRYAQESPPQFAELSGQAVYYSAAVSLPVVLMLVYFAPEIICTVYSTAFTAAVLPFRILIVTLGLYMIDQVFAHSLVARGLQNQNLMALALGTLVNISLNLVLIPALGPVGASISTLVSMAALATTHYYCVSRSLYHLRLGSMALALLVALVPIGGALALMEHSRAVLILLPLLSVCYVGLVLLARRRLLTAVGTLAAPRAPRPVPDAVP